MKHVARDASLHLIHLFVAVNMAIIFHQIWKHVKVSYLQFLLIKQYVCNDNYFYADVNECKLKISNCHEHADCMNTEGSYECQCKDGYQGNGIICTGISSDSMISMYDALNHRSGWFLNLDIDECDTGLHDCDKNANCNNTNGSFLCTCKESSFGNGKECKRKHYFLIAWLLLLDLECVFVAGYHPMIEVINTTTPWPGNNQWIILSLFQFIHSIGRVVRLTSSYSFFSST